MNKLRNKILKEIIKEIFNCDKDKIIITHVLDNDTFYSVSFNFYNGFYNDLIVEKNAVTKLERKSKLDKLKNLKYKPKLI